MAIVVISCLMFMLIVSLVFLVNLFFQFRKEDDLARKEDEFNKEYYSQAEPLDDIRKLIEECGDDH